MRFEDVLVIKNGRNQRAVENPQGKYPIYGSGGIMGYADDYICKEDTVVRLTIRNKMYYVAVAERLYCEAGVWKWRWF